MKLFSTSSLLIPTILKMIIIPVTPKIVFLLFRESEPKKLVILESCSLIRVYFLSEQNLKELEEE